MHMWDNFKKYPFWWGRTFLSEGMHILSSFFGGRVGYVSIYLDEMH